jgi:hypothetical protein
MPQINAPIFLLLSLKSFIAEKRHVAIQKLFKKGKRIEKMEEKGITSLLP